MYIVQKPDSTLSPALQRNEKTIELGTLKRFGLPVNVTAFSPTEESACGGNRIASTVPMAKMTNANRSAHSDPKVAAPAASGPRTAPPQDSCQRDA